MAESFHPVERTWRLLEYLRRNTDEKHLISQKEPEEDPVLKPLFKKTTPQRAMSPEELKREERRERSLPIRDPYYRHTFSYEEVNARIEGILFSRTLGSRDAKRLVEKIEGNLTSNFYKKGPENICTIRETVLADRGLLRENLLLIQWAIDDGVQEVDRLSQTWSEDFTLHHLNMDFGKPIPIKLRIYRGGHPETDYTFLYDWFGDAFRYERTEAEGDIVRVWCGAFSMVNWALQYADRVEVLEPKARRCPVAS